MSEVCPQSDNWCTSHTQPIKASLLWTIDYFSKSYEKMRQSIDSSTFSLESEPKTKWYLALYPDGGREESEDFIAIYLKIKDSDRNEVSVTYKLAIIDGNYRVFKQFETNQIFKKCDGGWGYTKFISKSLLLDPKNNLLPEDRLTIYCEVWFWSERQITIGRKKVIKRSKTIINDMRGLFRNQKYSDVEIVVKGQTFIAHKIILQTRSPVFAAMFEHPIKESQQNRVIIEDIDEEVFERVLRFIYTDVVVNDNIDSNLKLLSAADKYNLKDLKTICEQNIANQLNVKTVCDVLIMADNHSALELRTQAIHYLTLNANEVMKSENWKRVMERPDLMKLLDSNHSSN